MSREDVERDAKVFTNTPLHGIQVAPVLAVHFWTNLKNLGC
jgi:hypothetical protein